MRVRRSNTLVEEDRDYSACFVNTFVAPVAYANIADILTVRLKSGNNYITIFDGVIILSVGPSNPLINFAGF